MVDFFETGYGSEILLRTGEHLVLVLLAMGFALIISIPVGIVIAKRPNLAPTVLTVANIIQTVPSLALFGFLITVPLLGGIGKTPAIFALTLYALLPLIRNTYTGMSQIAPGFREAGQSLGLSDWQILWYIELPLALPVILSGVRVSTVICVGIATIAAAIGGGGLGVFIFRGISTVNNQLILAGAIPSAVIALLADWGISLLEKRFTSNRGRKRRSKFQSFVLAAIVGFLLLSGVGLIWRQIAAQGVATIAIGSKNFTEQVILGEILAQKIEEETKLKVDRQFNLGGTFICHEAVKAAKIDMYVEYTGTALTAVLKEKPLKDPQEVYDLVKARYAKEFGLVVMPSLGFNNTFAIVIRQEDADKYKLKNLSDAAKYTPQWQAGFGYEFIAREDGYPGLAKTYGLKFRGQPQAMEIGLMYRALADKQVDLVAGNSTDGLISVLKLIILEDDKRYFPPYEAVPIVNENSLKKYPQLRQVFAGLSNAISAAQMQDLNYQVEQKSEDLEVIVREFLKGQGK